MGFCRPSATARRRPAMAKAAPWRTARRIVPENTERPRTRAGPRAGRVDQKLLLRAWRHPEWDWTGLPSRLGSPASPHEPADQRQKRSRWTTTVAVEIESGSLSICYVRQGRPAERMIHDAPADR